MLDIMANQGLLNCGNMMLDLLTEVSLNPLTPSSPFLTRDASADRPTFECIESIEMLDELPIYEAPCENVRLLCGGDYICLDETESACHPGLATDVSTPNVIASYEDDVLSCILDLSADEVTVISSLLPTFAETLSTDCETPCSSAMLGRAETEYDCPPQSQDYGVQPLCNDYRCSFDDLSDDMHSQAPKSTGREGCLFKVDSAASLCDRTGKGCAFIGNGDVFDDQYYDWEGKRCTDAPESTSAKSQRPSRRKSTDRKAKQKRQAVNRNVSSNNLKKCAELSEFSGDKINHEDNENASANGKGHPSKNLVSERKRRMKLNDRLYSLRSIIPKISKMDKASIVGDAITYLQDLQKRVKDLQDEIIVLEEDNKRGDGDETHDLHHPVSESAVGSSLPCYKILLNVSAIDSKMFTVRVSCPRTDVRMLVQLTKALEAIDLAIVNANVVTVNDHILNTIVVRIHQAEACDAERLKELIQRSLAAFGIHV
ncbi:hypothetical protein KP509_01G091600 [Ceratopteris richardii]|uniref:BHLH domain-containing protein n=1 Tax=Ceratopteris richardii TaxID=49495 RepID=A0A8T2VIP3_CERRI|nr:hypothetical protein KP509_01G091600 [Ceratopteris richardii]